MTIDSDGNLWIAVFGGGGVSIITVFEFFLHNSRCIAK